MAARLLLEIILCPFFSSVVDTSTSSPSLVASDVVTVIRSAVIDLEKSFLSIPFKTVDVLPGETIGTEITARDTNGDHAILSLMAADEFTIGLSCLDLNGWGYTSPSILATYVALTRRWTAVVKAPMSDQGRLPITCTLHAKLNGKIFSTRSVIVKAPPKASRESLRVVFPSQIVAGASLFVEVRSVHRDYVFTTDPKTTVTLLAPGPAACLFGGRSRMPLIAELANGATVRWKARSSMVSCTAGQYSVRVVLDGGEISNAFGVVGDYVVEVQAGTPDPSYGTLYGWPEKTPGTPVEVVAGELPWTLRVSPRDAFGGRSNPSRHVPLDSSFKCTASTHDGTPVPGASCAAVRIIYNYDKEDPAIVSISKGAVSERFNVIEFRVLMTVASDSPVLLRFLLHGVDVVPAQLVHVRPGPPVAWMAHWRWDAPGLPAEPFTGLSYSSKLPISMRQPYESVVAARIRIQVADKFGNVRPPPVNSSEKEASVVVEALDTGLTTNFGPLIESRTRGSWYVDGAEYVLEFSNSDLYASRFRFTLRVHASPGKSLDARSLVVSFTT